MQLQFVMLKFRKPPGRLLTAASRGKWEGGLIEGDEIISINGIPIDALGYFGIYELLGDISITEYEFFIRTPDGDVEQVIVRAD